MEFRGIKSTEYGARLMDVRKHVLAAERGESRTAAGRDGDMWQSDNARDTISLKRSLTVRESQLDGVMAWLTGNGLLRFEYAPGRAYDARITDKIEIEQVSLDSDPLMSLSVSFTCQPYQRIYPEPENIEFTQNNALLETEGNAPSQPRIKIEGSGDFSLTIGQQTMFFTGIDGGIIVDSELQDALSLDGAELLNNHAAGQFFEIQPGSQYVSWALETGAQITKITMTPRWRCL